MLSFELELASNAYVQLFTDKTFNSFTNFLGDHLNLEAFWGVETSEISYPSRYQSITVGKIMYFEKKLSKSSGFQNLKPANYLLIADIALAMNIFLNERQQHSENCITLEVSRRTRTIEIFLQMKDPFLNSLLRTWDTFSEIMLAMNLERC